MWSLALAIFHASIACLLDEALDRLPIYRVIGYGNGSLYKRHI